MKRRDLDAKKYDEFLLRLALDRIKREKFLKHVKETHAECDKRLKESRVKVSEAIS
ncbi:hypothetical protein J7L97_02565 [Candidatus Bathyarchaeota archaeon]|nr:hypothetical protein [Candidatus Bathyarchaeota archaeon]